MKIPDYNGFRGKPPVERFCKSFRAGWPRTVCKTILPERPQFIKTAMVSRAILKHNQEALTMPCPGQIL